VYPARVNPAPILTPILSPPIEPVSERGGEVDTTPLGEIGSEPYVGERGKFTKFEVCTTFDKDGCNPVVKFSTPFHSEARTNKKHRVNLITVRCGKAGVEKDALGGSGLTGIDVGHNADVARIFEMFV